jgi:hypothetical protein
MRPVTAAIFQSINWIIWSGKMSAKCSARRRSLSKRYSEHKAASGFLKNFRDSVESALSAFESPLAHENGIRFACTITQLAVWHPRYGCMGIITPTTFLARWRQWARVGVSPNERI